MWVKIEAIGHRQQDPIVQFPVDDVLDEKNARQSTNAVGLERWGCFYLVLDWVSRVTELTIFVIS